MRLALIAVPITLAACTTAPAQPAERAAAADQRTVAFQDQMTGFIERLRADPNAPPGFVVVAVDPERALFEGAYGVRDLSTGAPMTLDTPIDNASVTKAYTGLLAAMFDAEGVLRLDESLSDVWPGLELSPPLDASGATVVEMLSHQNEVWAGGIVFRSYTGEITASDVPTHLAQYAVPNESSFEYTNYGPIVVSAMLQARTGEPWRDLMRDRVFEPLSLSHTVSDTDAFSADQLAHCHTRFDGAWQSLPRRPTITISAAGGMHASGRDSARFLQLFMSDGRSAQGRFAPEVLRRTWVQAAERPQEIWGLQRDGYGLGWDLGSYDGRRFVARSGGSPGCRATIMFLPEHNFGIAVLSAGDASANTFNSLIFRQAIDYWLGAPDAETRAQARISSFPNSAATEAARIDAEQAPWRERRPLGRALISAAEGAYENPRLGRAIISRDGEGLSLQIGAFLGEVRPAGEGLVLMERRTFEADTFEFVRGQSGAIEAIIIDDDRYERRR
jgi:CubicO group peptidase (beta-lactamase class C family)